VLIVFYSPILVVSTAFDGEAARARAASRAKRRKKVPFILQCDSHEVSVAVLVEYAGVGDVAGVLERGGNVGRYTTQAPVRSEGEGESERRCQYAGRSRNVECGG
jgi:hypothetical protein